MKIYDILENHQIEEGPNDPAIFKAVFLAGGPGSGKSYVATKILSGLGLKPVNSDEIYEYLAYKQDLDLGNPDEVASDQGQEVRDRAKQLTDKRQNIYIDGRIGLIIDGTGKDVQKVKDQSEKLKTLGYECSMIFVNTNLQVAQERNAARARTIPADMVQTMWQKVQENIMKFQQVFGAKNFHVVDNSGGLEDPERKENFDNVYKSIRAFTSSEPSSHIAKKWLDNAKSKNTT
jgi:cytidylate kinase